jgi:hypothetical protein
LWPACEIELEIRWLVLVGKADRVKQAAAFVETLERTAIGLGVENRVVLNLENRDDRGLLLLEFTAQITHEMTSDDHATGLWLCSGHPSPPSPSTGDLLWAAVAQPSRDPLSAHTQLRAKRIRERL